MKILAIEKETAGVAAETFRPHLQAEAARVWKLYQAGVFRELYFRQGRPSAIVMLECADVEEAGQVLNTLPLASPPQPMAGLRYLQSGAAGAMGELPCPRRFS